MEKKIDFTISSSSTDNPVAFSLGFTVPLSTEAEIAKLSKDRKILIEALKYYSDKGVIGIVAREALKNVGEV